MNNRFLSAGSAKKKPVGRDFVFFPPNFFFINQNVQGGEIKKKIFFRKFEQKSSSRPFLAHSGSGQETTFHLRPRSHIPTGLNCWVGSWPVCMWDQGL